VGRPNARVVGVEAAVWADEEGGWLVAAGWLRGWLGGQVVGSCCWLVGWLARWLAEVTG